MKKRLLLLFAFTIFATMTIVVCVASMQENLLLSFPLLAQNPWFKTTCIDLYISLSLIYLWIFLREPSTISRIFWFFMMMGLGSIATGAYLFVALLKMPARFTIAEFLMPTPTMKKGTLS